jgi:hypothetical protein
LLVAAWLSCTLALSPTAGAHQGNPNFTSKITSVSPAVKGLSVAVLNHDDRLELINRTGRTVLIKGYQGEPYIRILADGTVAVNHNSPAFYLNEDRFGNSEVPATARPGAAPDWQAVDKTGRYDWHDHRIHYMSKGLPNQVKDKKARTKIFDWRVPIVVGSRPGRLTGTLFWDPASSAVPVGAIVALALFGAVAVVVVVLRRRNMRRPGKPQRPTKDAWG